MDHAWWPQQPLGSVTAVWRVWGAALPWRHWRFKQARPSPCSWKSFCAMWGCLGSHLITSLWTLRNPQASWSSLLGNRHHVKPAYCFWAPNLCQGLTHALSLESLTVSSARGDTVRFTLHEWKEKKKGHPSMCERLLSRIQLFATQRTVACQTSVLHGILQAWHLLKAPRWQ